MIVLIKNPKFILILLLVVFFLKGVFLMTLFPIFMGQDEARHYNSMQYLAEPKEKTWKMVPRKIIRDKESIDEYNFSEEIINTGLASDFDIVRHRLFDTVNFSQNFSGLNEEKIISKQWGAINYYDPHDTAGASLYHRLGSTIEKLFQNDNILVRFYSIRIFSVLFGTLAIFLAFLIAKNIGFSQKSSLILAAIIAFQPKYSIYTGNINYDALLIPMFFLFTLGGVLALKNGPSWKNLSLMIFASIIAYLTKGTGVVLFGTLAIFLSYFGHQNIKEKSLATHRGFYILFAIVTVVLFFFFKNYLPLEGGISAIFTSLGKYLDKSLTLGRFALSTRTYWGTLSWVESWPLSNATNIIWFIKTFSVIGLILYFVSKKKPDWLPEKKYIIFLLFMIVALQLGIRIYDWNVFFKTGSLDLGTPGRYFLPNLASHIILLFTGLGMFLHVFKQDKHFKTVLASGLILMFSFSLYLIFDVIIYRFYL